MMFADKIKQLREQKNLLQRQMSAALEIDSGLYSKIERGDRRAKREQVIKLAEILNADTDELLTLWLADQLNQVADNEKSVAAEAFKIAQQQIEK